MPEAPGGLPVRPDAGPEIAFARHENQRSCLLEASWPLARVAVQSTDALQQDVDRAQIGDQQVCVQIERLLNGLRRNHDTSASGPLFAQPRFQCLVQ